jgi:excisionase family DNA binding protein
MDFRGLSAYLPLSRRTIHTLVNDPVDPLPAYRIGNKLLFRRSEVDKWVSRRRNRKPLDLARLTHADAKAMLNAHPKKGLDITARPVGKS